MLIEFCENILVKNKFLSILNLIFEKTASLSKICVFEFFEKKTRIWQRFKNTLKSEDFFVNGIGRWARDLAEFWQIYSTKSSSYTQKLRLNP